MSDQLLINSIYPIEYFKLPGVDQVDYPDNFWWSSKERMASIVPGSNDVYAPVATGGALTSEVLEIDLGRVREINYINMDVLAAPIDIKIEYDQVSSPDRAAEWSEVRHIEGLPFSNQVFYSAGSRNLWYNSDLFFTDPRGGMVHTRYLRITFTRRDEVWPTSQAKPFKWPIMVKHLRVARYIANTRDTVGPLLSQDTPANLVKYDLPTDTDNLSTEIRQRFRVPTAALRGGDVWPNILGFGLLMKVTPESVDTQVDQLVQQGIVNLSWSLWDVSTDSEPFLIRNGLYEDTYDVGTTWVDWYLDDDNPIPLAPDQVYEFRVSSQNTLTADTVFLSLSQLSSTLLPGTLAFTSGNATVNTSANLQLQLEAGSWIQTSSAPGSALQIDHFVTTTQFVLTAPFPAASDATATASRVYPLLQWNGSTFVQDGAHNLVMRVWADVADEGRDILGNSYRYGVRRDRADYVLDRQRAGWMSDPAPSQDAVEALYFDVRSFDSKTNQFQLALLDGMRIAPRTPGVKMNIYYSKENLQGDRPTGRDPWDYLLWTPISQRSFILRKNQLLQFPQSIRAGYIKLEFTELNPIPWRVPNFPPLPPKLYRRFPTWVEDQFNNSQSRNVVEDWWLRNSTPVQKSTLGQITDPILEFEYKEREFFAALAMGEVAADRLIGGNLVSPDENAILDPTTGSKIYLSFDNQYKNTLLVSVDQNTVLGNAVVNRFDPFASEGATERQINNIPQDAIPTVSSVTNRITESYSHLATVPMRFNKTARHVYRQDEAEYNRKAYFVGIDKVSFIRNDYTIKHDDAVIQDILYDDVMMEENSWEREATSSITDGALLYATYQIGTGTDYYVDEAITLSGSLPTQLQGKGEPISQILIYEKPSKKGVQFWQNDDWTVSRGIDENGLITHSVSRSVYTERLGVPEQPIFYTDAAIVRGHAIIPVEPHDDGFGVVGYTPPIGHAVISAVEVYQTPILDAGTVVGVGHAQTAAEGPWEPGYGELRDEVVLGRPSQYGDGTYGNG